MSTLRQITRRFQQACRSALRPAADMARKLLTPSPQPTEFVWQRIMRGPAVGTEMLLPKETAIARAMTSGNYEERILSVVASLVSPGDTCFDVGGHYGYYTMALAKMAPAGQIHAFEPVGAHAKRIQKSIERAGLRHVTVHEVAVAGEAGEMPLQFSDRLGGDDSMAYLEAYGGVDTLAAREHYPTFSRTMVRTVTLDSLLTNLLRPRFVKIDAEGAEAPILRGGLRLISEAQPRLLVEMHGIREAIQCAEILDGANYQAVLLTDQKETLPVLWAPRNDQDAVNCVRRVLGHEPTIVFSRKDVNATMHQP